MDFEKISELSSYLDKKNVDGFIISSVENIFYTTGFRGISESERESMVFFDGHTFHLFVSPMYYDFERNRINNKNIKLYKFHKSSSFIDFVKEVVSSKKNSNSKVLVEEQNLSYKEFILIRSKLGFKLIKSDSVFAKIREIKTDAEIKKIVKIIDLSQKIFNQFILSIHKLDIQSKSELDLADLFLKISRTYQVDGFSFAPIIATSKNSANAHHRTGHSKICKGPLLLDFGFELDGYLSDISRTIHIGDANKEFVKNYQRVLECNRNCIQSISVKRSFFDIHQIAVDYFRKDNLQDNFIHSIGHGIGLKAHELPFVNRESKEKLKQNQVITIEPGLYFPNEYGIRIEDMVLVEKEKYSLLTESISKDLICIGN